MRRRVVATVNHGHGLFHMGHNYPLVDLDHKGNQVLIVDEREITCWYSWEFFIFEDQLEALIHEAKKNGTV